MTVWGPAPQTNSTELPEKAKGTWGKKEKEREKTRLASRRGNIFLLFSKKWLTILRSPFWGATITWPVWATKSPFEPVESVEEEEEEEEELEDPELEEETETTDEPEEDPEEEDPEE